MPLEVNRPQHLRRDSRNRSCSYCSICFLRPQHLRRDSRNRNCSYCSICFLLVKEVEEPELVKGTTILDQPPSLRLRPWQWWILVTLNITFLLIGQCGAVILAILDRPSIPMLSLIYFFLGALLAGDNMLYSIGLLYLPVSTYSLICTTQLAFNAIFSFFINSQKFTPWIINSLVLLTLSASLVAVNSDPTEHKGVSKGKYALGFICTLGASTCYSLLLSLMQLSFEKVLKRETLSVVLEMQIYTSLVATFISIGGLFASGEWRDLRDEMESFKEGRVLYFMALVGASLAWQVSSIGVVGLIFVVSSLFANVISTLALPLVPVAAVLFYRAVCSRVLQQVEAWEKHSFSMEVATKPS
ncbi:putative purine permease 11 [Vitis vinifera]|uniref:Probable purine permease n=1 Tax=Vitis vinifera TaxID=29760 RepID=A0A438HBY2_VITVI|nr:putative purine permease 11 [Vitis vinifera]